MYPTSATVPISERPSFQLWNVKDLERIYDIQIFGPGYAGVCCADFSIIVIAGLAQNKLPEKVQEMMKAHKQKCAYHQSSDWKKVVTSVQVTVEMKATAEEVIEKLNKSKREEI
jgi:hypothetical protein